MIELFVFYVYILRLKDGTFYVGFSSDLKNRINEHHKGKVAQTQKLKPLKLIYYSAFESKTKALRFEEYLKTCSGFAFRNKHLIDR